MKPGDTTDGDHGFFPRDDQDWLNRFGNPAPRTPDDDDLAERLDAERLDAEVTAWHARLRRQWALGPRAPQRRSGRPAERSPARSDSPDLASARRGLRALTQFIEATPDVEFRDKFLLQLIRRAHQKRTHPDRTAVGVAVAAFLILMIALTTLTVTAPPGGPLSGMRSIVTLFTERYSGDTSARSRLHQASAALDYFDLVASQGDDENAVRALTDLVQANQQVASAITAVHDPTRQGQLSDQFLALRTRENLQLRAALPHLEWPTRIRVTDVLRGLRVPGAADLVSVDYAWIAGPSSGPARSTGQVTIFIGGDDFRAGVVVLLNGGMAGKISAISDSKITARLPADAVGQIMSIGVGMPDGTAAKTMDLTFGKPPNAI